jgi:hypothetical protein
MAIRDTAPRGFDRAAYQKRINEITGCSDGRPLIKLIWCPDEFRWMPHKLQDDPLGYVFPVFCNNRNPDGEFKAPERWGLMDRLEWGQYGPTWEGIRYKKHKGDVWDLKGPCPSEKYAELKCHLYHNGKCCSCIGEECECATHCWGVYVEPNESLLNWIRKTSWESRHDSDIDPHGDVRFFEAPNTQRAVANVRQQAYDKSNAEVETFDREAVDLFLRSPVSVEMRKKEIQRQSPVGFKKSKSGLYLLN